MLGIVLTYFFRDSAQGIRASVESNLLAKLFGIASAGLVIGAARLFYTLNNILAPSVVKRLGSKLSSRLGLLIMSLTLFSISFVSNFKLYLLLRILFAAGAGIHYPVFVSIVQNWLRRSEKKGLKWGILLAVSSLSGSFGSFLASFLAPSMSSRVLLRISALLLALASISVPDPKEHLRPVKISFSSLKKRELLPLLIHQISFSSFWGARDVVYPAVFGISTAGMIFGLSGVTAGILSPFVGRLVDKLGWKNVFSAALLFLAIFSFLIPFFPQLIIPLSLLYVVGEILSGPSTSVMLTQLLEERERVIVNSTLGFIYGLFLSAGSAFSGIAYRFMGLKFFVLNSLLYFIALVYLNRF